MSGGDASSAARFLPLQSHETVVGPRNTAHIMAVSWLQGVVCRVSFTWSLYEARGLLIPGVHCNK